MSEFHLTDLQYSNDRNGPWGLYIYQLGSEYHARPIWFERKPKYPEEGEITIPQAQALAEKAIAEGREVRIVDGGDRLVSHWKDGANLFGEKFWEEIGGA